MKTISIFLALINSIFAGLLIMYNLPGHQSHASITMWLLIDTISAISVIVIGVFTWFACIHEMSTGPILLSGLYLVVLGSVTIVWTYHLAVINRYPQYYMAVFGASLMAQGLSSLLGFSDGPISMTNS